MKKILSIFLTFISFYVLNAQTASVMDGCAPLTVNFTSPPGATTSHWDFKDGSSSLLLSPSVTFLSPGTYDVEYRATQNGPVISIITIAVAPKPVPTFTADITSGCVPLTVNFSDLTTVSPSINVTGYTWVFGDGGIAMGKNARHTFTRVGSFLVSLEINTNSPSCDVTNQVSNYINTSPKPNAQFTTNPNPPVACTPPLNVSFNNTSNSPSGSTLSYQWNMGNGQTYTIPNPPDQTYTIPQAYEVKLIATDANGCQDSSIRAVSVGSPEPLLQYDDTLCMDTRDTIYNFSSGSATWSLNQPGLVNHGLYRGLHPAISFETPGVKTINLRLSAGGCFKDTTLTIFVPEVVSDFVSTPSYSCQFPVSINYTSTSTSAANSTFRWVFNDGTFQTGSTVTKLHDDPKGENPYFINGPTYIRSSLIVTDPSGCQDTEVRFDTIHEPTALMVPSVAKGCVPLDVTFSDLSIPGDRSNIVTWEWVFGDGNSVTRSNSLEVSNTYNTTGEFNAYLIITTNTGCKDTSYLTKIRVGEPITPNFVADKLSICIGDTVSFTDLTSSPIRDSIDTWNYSSEGDRLFSCFANNSPSWTYNSEVGFQDVTMTVGYNGCYTSFTRQDYIEVKGAVAEIDYLSACDQKFLVDFKDSSQNSNNTLWRFGDGNTSVNNHPSHTYASTGDYTVILEAEDVGSGCQATFDTAQIYIRDIQAAFEIDSLICQGEPVLFDASLSNDVYGNCHRGYTWMTSDPEMRPYTASSDSVYDPFVTPGLTNVQLIVTDINGCSDTLDKNVRVYGIEAHFSVNDTFVCPGQALVFSDSSTSDTTITQWNWSFGDGTNSADPSPSTSYQTLAPLNFPELPFPATDRTYVTNLAITNAIGCRSDHSIRMFMYRPSSLITIDDPSICVGSEVNFSASDFTLGGSNLTFDWDFKNGETSASQTPSSTFNTEGNFLVELEIEEIATGCKNNYTNNIEVVDFPTAGFFTSADDQKYLCPGTDNILFTDTSQSSVATLDYQWNFGNGVTSTFQNPGTFYRDNGPYTIQQIVAVPVPFGCADTVTRTVTVKGPSGNFVTDLRGDTICRGEFVNFRLIDTTDVETFFWSFGDGDSVKGISPIDHQYNFVPLSGQTVAKLIMSNSDGSCEITQDTIIDIYEVKADFLRNDGMDTAICFDSYPVTNLSRNADNWNWDFGDGTVFSGETPPILNYATPGVYPVQLSVSNNQLGCKDTIVKIVILDPGPEPILKGDTLCEGDVAFVNVTNPNIAWTYAWQSSPAIAVSNDSASSFTTQPLTTTEFYLSIIDTNSCSSLDTTTVFVINSLGLTDFDTTIAIGDSIDLPVYVNAGLYDFTWTGTEGLSCLDCSPPRVQPLEKVSYNLVLKDVVGCFEYDVNFLIDLHPETFVKLPTSFTPNGDQVNDIVYAEGWGIKELLEYKIFNRWGEVVFETTNLEEGWDGTHKGEEQNSDVYVYKVRVLTWRDEERALEGYINLIR